MNYYYYMPDTNEVAGPISLDDLTTLVAAGQLSEATQICPEGQSTWRPLSDLQTDPSKPPIPFTDTTAWKVSTIIDRRPYHPFTLFVAIFGAVVLGGAVVLSSYLYLTVGKTAEPLSNKVVVTSHPIPLPTIPPVAPLPPAYQDFLHEARRLVTAMQSGVSFNDFHTRAVDVIASANEVVTMLPPGARQEAISKFASSVLDLDTLWTYQISNPDRWEINGDYPSERWFSHQTELITIYQLDANDDGIGSAMDASYHIVMKTAELKLFRACTNDFDNLDRLGSSSSK